MTNPPTITELAEELREFTAMKYAGDCKCGKCQLVPHALVERIYHTLNAARLSTPADQAVREARPRAFLSWAVEMFGPVAKLRSERLLRFVEEAIELAHAEGMERDVFNKVADRVYSRPAGNVGKEIGQAQACLETFAENIGLSSDAEAQREWVRVQEIPREEWTRRHSAKQAIGIALPSPAIRSLSTTGAKGIMSDNIRRAERKEREARDLLREAAYLRDLQKRLDGAEQAKGGPTRMYVFPNDRKGI